VPLQEHTDSVWSVAYSPDGTRIASGSADGTVRMWGSLSSMPSSEPLQHHSDVVNSVAYSPDGTRVVSGSDDMTVRVWDAITGAPIGEPLQGHTSEVWSVAFSPTASRSCQVLTTRQFKYGISYPVCPLASLARTL